MASSTGLTFLTVIFPTIQREIAGQGALYSPSPEFNYGCGPMGAQHPCTLTSATPAFTAAPEQIKVHIPIPLVAWRLHNPCVPHEPVAFGISCLSLEEIVCNWIRKGNCMRIESWFVKFQKRKLYLKNWRSSSFEFLLSNIWFMIPSLSSSLRSLKSLFLCCLFSSLFL